MCGGSCLFGMLIQRLLGVGRLLPASSKEHIHSHGVGHAQLNDGSAGGVKAQQRLGRGV